MPLLYSTDNRHRVDGSYGHNGHEAGHATNYETNDILYDGAGGRVGGYSARQAVVEVVVVVIVSAGIHEWVARVWLNVE